MVSIRFSMKLHQMKKRLRSNCGMGALMKMNKTCPHCGAEEWYIDDYGDYSECSSCGTRFKHKNKSEDFPEIDPYEDEGNLRSD